MQRIGKLVNGSFVQVAGNYDVLATPDASESERGLMSKNDKQKLDKAYTSDDVATSEQIINEIWGGNK